MKKIFTSIAVLCCLLILAPSCAKQSPLPATQPEQVINTIVAPGKTYTFTPPSSGVLSINRQAAHFATSEVGTEGANNMATYQYAPAAGYKGPDEVSLKFSTTVLSPKNGGGCNRGSNNDTYTTVTNTIVIKITVAD